jgi:hypothetical protein
VGEETKLLPCPFCGGPAMLKEDISYKTGKPTGLWWVQCDPCDTFPDACWHKPKDEAVAAWNTRTPAPTSGVTEAMIEAGIAACLASPWFDFDIDEAGLRQSGLVPAIYLAMSAARPAVDEGVVLNDIAVMMSEFVDNWPNPKRLKTALALIAKTLRNALDPPKHDFWGAGEKDCPRGAARFAAETTRRTTDAFCPLSQP